MIKLCQNKKNTFLEPGGHHWITQSRRIHWLVQKSNWNFIKIICSNESDYNLINYDRYSLTSFMYHVDSYTYYIYKIQWPHEALLHLQTSYLCFSWIPLFSLHLSFHLICFSVYNEMRGGPLQDFRFFFLWILQACYTEDPNRMFKVSTSKKKKKKP